MKRVVLLLFLGTTAVGLSAADLLRLEQSLDAIHKEAANGNPRDPTPRPEGHPYTCRGVRDRLLYVRYRYDPETNTRVTTVELIVDRRPAGPASPRPASATAALPPGPQLGPPESKTTATGARALGTTLSRTLGPGLVALRINTRETALCEKVKGAGGYWDPNLGFWVLRVDHVRALGLASRLVVPAS